MNRYTLTLAGALALSSGSAFAQQPNRGVLPFNGEITTGVFDALTGKLLPAGTSFGLSLGEPIYVNDAIPAQGSFFFGIGGDVLFDEGRIPSTSSPDVVGTQDSYDISSINLQYATDATDPSLGGTGITIQLDFYESYVLCVDPTTPPTASVILAGLPGSTTGGIAGFVLDVDLTGLGINLAADGDGVYSMGADDLFGWSMAVTDPADSTAAGPFIRADPDFQPSGDGTAFQNPGAAAGSGLDTQDAFFRRQVDGSTPCSFFGGYPDNVFASFGMVIRSTFSVETICDGVPNSTGVGAELSTSGSLATADNSLTLNVSSLPMDTVGYFIVSQDTIFVANPGGAAGNICIASTSIGRYNGDVLDTGMGGMVSFSPDLASIPLTAGGGMSSTVAAMPGDVYNFQFWYRDTDMMGLATTNFSSAVSILFE